MSEAKSDMVEIISTDPLFNDIRWAIKALSQDDERPVLMHMHVETDGMMSYIVATDARRLHRVQGDDDILDRFEPGEYKVIRQMAKTIMFQRVKGLKYPNWKKIIPQDLEDPERKYEELHWDVDVPEEHLFQVCVTLAKLGIRQVNTRYIQDALSDGVNLAYAEDEVSPIIISANNLLAVVMPMRVS